MKRYFLYLKLFFKLKFVFKDPPKKKLVIFDGDAIYDLKNFIYEYDYFILKIRIGSANTFSPEAEIDKVYISIKLLKLFLKNYKGNVMTAYLTSVLEVINPKLVITYIDNSIKFSELARSLGKKMTFVAIQNAARYNLIQNQHLYEKKMIKSDITEKFYIPNYFCFGDFEIDQFKKYKVNVENFFKVGSLRLSNFIHYVKKNKIAIKKNYFDICLISEPADGRDLSYGEKGIESGSAKTIKYTIQFCIKNNMKLIFACKRDKKDNFQKYQDEFSFYKKHLTSIEYDYLIQHSLEKTIKNFTSYKAMIESKVVVGKSSTLLRENLALGGKILSCNLTPTNIYDFPLSGICSIKNCLYEEFEKRLMEIYSMKNSDYFLKINKDKSYIAEYDETNSTIDKIKRKINFFINE